MSEPEINLTKIELPIATEDSARVVDAVLDLFSPVTETLGALGDHVRLYRTNSVLKVIGETRRLADAAGIKLKRPPLRFLVPFIEEASLQEEGDEELVSMWSNLLLQAGADNTKSRRLMIDLLSRLSGEDAENLERIVRNPRTILSSVNKTVDVAFKFERSEIDDLLDRTLGKMSEGEALGEIVREVEDRGVIVISAGFYSFNNDDGKGEVWDWHDGHPDFPNEDDISLHSLASLGLVRFPLVYGRPYRGGRFSMIICLLTALGAEFFLNTHDPKLSEAGSTLPPYPPRPDEQE